MRIMAMAVLVCSTIAMGQLKLVEEGQSAWRIVLPDDATPAEKTGANELRDYLAKLTGATCPVVRESDAKDGPRVFVGAGKAVRQRLADVKWDELGDGIVIATSGQDLILAGGRPRGSLYAVYTFLEDTCGVRWWTSRDEFVPRNPTLSVPELNLRYTPALKYREVFNWDAIRDHALFAARQKLNGHMTQIPAELGGHYTLIGWCHTFYHFFPPQKYWGEHPEWYSLIDGKRQQMQLCLSNTEMRDEMIKVVLQQVRKNPEAGIISVSQNDTHGPCQCPQCQAIVKEEGSEAGPMIRFVNEVAAAVGEEYPDFLIETLAYQYTRHPPKKTKPAKNVLVRLCSIEADVTKPLTSESNKSFVADLRGWSAIAPNLFIWNYVTNFGHYLVPHPNYKPLAEDLRLFVANNVVGVFEQGDAFNELAGDMLPLRCWVLAHLCWDPSRDQAKLTREFLDGYFGPAAGPMGDYWDKVQAIADRPGFKRGCANGDTSYISNELLAEFQALFDKAESAVTDNAELLERVQRERLVIELLSLTRWPFAQKLDEAKKAGKKPADVARVYERAVRDFARRARQAGVKHISEGQNFASYVPSLLGAADRHIPVDMPKAGSALPPGQFDIQESQFSLHGVGKWCKLVDDPKASNGKAAWMPGDHTQWAVQWPVPADMAGQGPCKVYLVIRAEAKKKQGAACWIGLHDNATHQYLSRGPVGFDLLADGEYHAIPIPADKLTSSMYFWVSPPGDGNVTGIWVDRIVVMRAK